MSSQLPPGWTSHQAPDGRWYFSNTATNQTQWHHPGAPPAGPPHQPGQHQPYPPYAPQSQGHAPQQQQARPASSGAPPIGPAAARFILQQPTEFKLKEKPFSLSGDSFSIKRVDTGEPFFKVKGNAMSLKDSKTLFDMKGTPIYKMSEAFLTLRGRMSIVDPNTKETVITLRKLLPFFLFFPFFMASGFDACNTNFSFCSFNQVKKA